MCGRYVSPDEAAIEREFNLVHQEGQFPPSFNVAPTHQVPILREISGERRGSTVRWGLIPFFAKGEPPKYSTINARIESVETAASYRGPWQRGQRCLQFAIGFYEWHVNAEGRKAPYHIYLNDQPVFAFAALWERSIKRDGAVVESCVHITMPANSLMREIHNGGSNPHRMPAILKREDVDIWLKGSVDEARAVLRPYEANLMVAYEVGGAVNSPKNNDALLLRPVGIPSDEKILIESMRTTEVSFFESMECLPVSQIPEGPAWTYEIKLDGYRLEARQKPRHSYAVLAPSQHLEPQVRLYRRSAGRFTECHRARWAARRPGCRGTIGFQSIAKLQISRAQNPLLRLRRAGAQREIVN
jgi:putative SOS response-associated peptidase YedK